MLLPLAARVKLLLAAARACRACARLLQQRVVVERKRALKFFEQAHECVLPDAPCAVVMLLEERAWTRASVVVRAAETRAGGRHRSRTERMSNTRIQRTQAYQVKGVLDADARILPLVEGNIGLHTRTNNERINTCFLVCAAPRPGPHGRWTPGHATKTRQQARRARAEEKMRHGGEVAHLVHWSGGCDGNDVLIPLKLAREVLEKSQH